LSKGVARGVGKRALKAPAEILRDAVHQRAPELTGALKQSINVAPEKAYRGGPQIQVRADDVAAVQVEYGNSDQTAAPFFEPAVQAAKGQMFEAFAGALKQEVDKVVARAARKATKRG
jgi:HK97 gp10 family phage protein